MEALKLCRDRALLLWKLKMIMHAMQQQRIFVRRDSPRLKTEEVGCGSETRCQVDHAEVPTIGNRHSDTAPRGLQQVGLRDGIDGEEAPVFLFVNIAASRHRALLIDSGKA